MAFGFCQHAGIKRFTRLEQQLALDHHVTGFDVKAIGQAVDAVILVWLAGIKNGPDIQLNAPDAPVWRWIAPLFRG